MPRAVSPMAWQKYHEYRRLGWSRGRSAGMAGISPTTATQFDRERHHEEIRGPGTSERRSSGWAWLALLESADA